MASAYGLPRYVISFLRQLEAHKEYLKWNITEGSHKITLTLSWNFKKHRGKETVWEKLQRLQKTLKTIQGGQGEEPSVPPEIVRFLETCPSPRKQTHSAASTLRRHLSWAPFRKQLGWRRCSSFSLPNRATSASRSSFHEPVSPSRQVHMSPSRFSWPGTTLDLDDPGQTSSTPLTSTPRSFASSPERTRARIRLSYRTEEDIERSLEDLIEKTKESTLEKLEQIRQEWNETVKNWPKILISDEFGGSSVGAAAANNSSDMTDSDTDTHPLVKPDTVARCLQSCENILAGDYMETPV